MNEFTLKWFKRSLIQIQKNNDKTLYEELIFISMQEQTEPLVKISNKLLDDYYLDKYSKMQHNTQ